MTLPKITTPIYELKLLSREKPIKFRPFLVKEQKLMMMAVENKDPNETVQVLRQIANNCIMDEDIDVNELPIVDLQLLFLNLRARSMGEVIEVYYKCKNLVEDSECGMIIEFPINLLEVPVVNVDSPRRIMISDDIGIQLKLPTFEDIQLMIEYQNKNPEDLDGEFRTAAMSIDYIFDKDTVYPSNEASLDELTEFVSNLPQEKYDIVEKAFDNLPTIRTKIAKKCPKCGHDHNFVLEGLEDFFI